MGRKSARNLGKSLPDNIRYLSSMIARKPDSYTPKWAASIDEAFELYTNTRTINVLQSTNQLLIEYNWPFPAYLSLRRQKWISDIEWNFRRFYWLIELIRIYTGPSLQSIVISAGFIDAMGEDGRAACDKYMIFLFQRNMRPLFHLLKTAPVLMQKTHIVYEIQRTYEQKLWAACISLIMPLLDHIIRDFSSDDDLHMSIQVLRDALHNEANLRPKDFMPGSAVWYGKSDPETGNTFASTLEEDIRLPGIYLSSFFEFADQYYEWYSSTSAKPKSSLNRHAVMHCSSEFWSEANTIRMLTFLDLTLRLEKPLKVLIHGKGIDNSC